MSEISVVIPWGKAAGNIIRCLSSVLAQTLAPKQVIVAVNGSVSLAEVDRLKREISSPLVTYCLMRGCRNANIARNYGAALAGTEWIAYLDSDDWWDPEHLARSIAVLDATEADFLYSGMKELRVDGSQRILVASDYRACDGMENYLLEHRPAQTSSFVVRRSCVLAEPWCFDLKRHQDYEFIARHAEKYHGVFKADVTVNVDWSMPTRHKNHGDCFRVTRGFRGKVRPELLDRHCVLLWKSALRCFDLSWLRQLPVLVPALWRCKVGAARQGGAVS